MLVYAGIDEAGYGPMLGPLCVGRTVFVLEDGRPEDGAPDLWARLRGAVCRRKRDKRGRIAIDDSKKLKGASSAKTHPLKHLERGVLAAVTCTHEDENALPVDDDTLFELLGTTIAAEPWYDAPVPLPVADEADALSIAASRLRRALAKTSTRCTSVACEAIDAGSFNERVEKCGNKATVNFGAVMRHVDWIWQTYADAHPRIVVDRQGGRSQYREELQFAFPDAHIRIIAEEDSISRYFMKDRERELTISFAREADARHLPVALASMTAKYVRELHMARMNRFFVGHQPELKPTAGYVEDGRRYVKDIGPLITKLAIGRKSLVRSV